MSKSIIYQGNKPVVDPAKEAATLGVDITFPMRDNNRGDLSLISGVDNVEQSIECIMECFKGELVYYEEIGLGIFAYLHRPCIQDNADRIAHDAIEQILRYEGRVQQINLTGLAYPKSPINPVSKIDIRGEYYEILYNHPINIVYPLVLERE